MHDESLWLEIAWLCLLISLMAIGGANAMVPEIHRYVIEQRGWMRGDEFAALFAIAQASPGPNVLFITLIGWKVAGWPGAVASTVAMCGPSSTLALAAGRTMARNPQSRWRRVIK
ncbi:chromate transporter, partial [Rivihabitans pingtungensis]